MAFYLDDGDWKTAENNQTARFWNETNASGLVSPTG